MSDVLQTWATAMRPPTRMGGVEWCAEHVKLPHSDRSTKFDPAATPWLREPMEAVFDPLNYAVTCILPIGCSKTTMLEACSAYIVSEAPGYFMAVMQTDPDAKEWFETRGLPVLKACEPIAGLFPSDRHKTRRDGVMFPHMPYTVGSATRSFLQGRSARWVWMDEAWAYQPTMIGEAKKRLQRGRFNKKYVITSQGSVKGDDLHSEWAMTDQRRYHWKCPKCKQDHPWAWAQTKYDEIKNEAGDYDWAALAPSIHIVCPQCDARFQDNPTQRRALTDSSFYLPSNNNAVGGHVGFTTPSMVVWWDPLLPTVQEWLLANQSRDVGDFGPLRQFIQKQLAQFWEEEHSIPSLRIASDSYKKAHYKNGKKIDGHAFTFLTVDVQKDHFWGLVRQWTGDGGSIVVWEGRLGAWELIRDVQERYQVPNRCVFIDARYSTEDVAKQAALSTRWSEDGHRWNLLMGEDSDGYPFYTDDPDEMRRRGSRADKLKIIKPYSTFIERTSNGRIPYRFIKFSNRLCKDTLFSLVAGNGPHWGLPADISRDYRQHLAAEHKVEHQPGKWRYEKVNRRAQNHLLDCEVMQIVAASIFGVLGE